MKFLVLLSALSLGQLASAKGPEHALPNNKEHEAVKAQAIAMGNAGIDALTGSHTLLLARLARKSLEDKQAKEEDGKGGRWRVLSPLWKLQPKQRFDTTEDPGVNALNPFGDEPPRAEKSVLPPTPEGGKKGESAPDPTYTTGESPIRRFQSPSPELSRSLRELEALLLEASRSVRRVARNTERSLARREGKRSLPHQGAPVRVAFPPPISPLTMPSVPADTPETTAGLSTPGSFPLVPSLPTTSSAASAPLSEAPSVSAGPAKTLLPPFPLPLPAAAQGPAAQPPSPPLTPASLSVKWAAYASLPQPVVTWGSLEGSETDGASGGTDGQGAPGTPTYGESSEGSAGTGDEPVSAPPAAAGWLALLPEEETPVTAMESPSETGASERGPSRLAWLAARPGLAFSWLVPDRSDFVRFAGESLGLPEADAIRLYEAIRALAWIATAVWFGLLLRQGSGWLPWLLTPARARSRRRYASGRTSAR